MNIILKVENIASLIYFIRGEKVMSDSDLADLYGVETLVLNQAVKRNIDRFPSDFMFQLNETEFKNFRPQFVLNSDNSSQIVMSSRNYRGVKYFPLACTEQGVAMTEGDEKKILNEAKKKKG